MEQAIGVSSSGTIAVGLVEGDRVVFPVSIHSSGQESGSGSEETGIHSMPMEVFVATGAEMIQTLCREHDAHPSVVGIGFPGIVRNGVIEESPNLKQAKGSNLCGMLTEALTARGLTARVTVCNDADAVAAGIAARGGHLEKLIRVWTLGDGIGFGRYPRGEAPWEGGHTVVTLDPKEAYCGCGGRGHLEGIMGRRAMRLRFLDLEPEEVFAGARRGEPRCTNFELFWHRALAAASATSIHLEGPGKFFICGPDARFVRIGLLDEYVREMVAMSPLQGSVFEVVPTDDELAIVGAAINAGRE
jgi:glucokinase